MQMSRVLLLRQIWIVNYYIKCSSDNLNNKNNKHWCFQRNDISRTVHFGILIHVLSWNIYFRLLRKNTIWKSTIIWWNNWHSLFDGVEGLDYWIQNFQFLFSWKKRLSPFLLVKYLIKIQILDRNSPVKS